jgi:SAM-dependent methyltransferase
LTLHARFTRTRVALADMFGEDLAAAPTLLSRDDFFIGQPVGRSAAVVDLPPIHDTPWEWLSASVAHHTLWDDPIFQDAITSMGDGLSILDAGCGVGASLWSLLPATARADRAAFSYHGITLSQAEVFLAKEMIRRQNLTDESILVEQRSYDDPALPRAHYNLVVALESLAFSPHLDTTIVNLVATLKPGGILVIADEFSLPGTVSTLGSIRRTPSLSTLLHYTTMLEAHGCSVRSLRDYALEFQYEGYHIWTDRPETSFWDALFSPWLPGSARRLYELQNNQRDLFHIFRDKLEDEREGRTTYALLLCQKTGQAL